MQSARAIFFLDLVQRKKLAVLKSPSEPPWLEMLSAIELLIIYRMIYTT